MTAGSFWTQTRFRLRSASEFRIALLFSFQRPTTSTSGPLRLYRPSLRAVVSTLLRLPRQEFFCEVFEASLHSLFVVRGRLLYHRVSESSTSFSTLFSL